MNPLPEAWMDLHFELAPSVAKRKIRGELFFLTPHSGELHDVNESGMAIWEQLEGGATPRDVYTALCTETDGDPEEIRADLQEFLQMLWDRGIMRLRP